MFAAGYSAQVPEEDQQNVIAVFQHLAEGDGFTFHSLQGEVGSGSIKFEHNFKLRLFLLSFLFSKLDPGPYQPLQRGKHDQCAKDGK